MKRFKALYTVKVLAAASGVHRTTMTRVLRERHVQFVRAARQLRAAATGN